MLLPNQVQAIAGSAHKVAVLGWVTGIGAAVAMNPICTLLTARSEKQSRRQNKASFARPPPASTTFCYLRVPAVTATAFLTLACAMRASRAICDGSRRGDMSHLSRSWNGSPVPQLPSVIGERGEMCL